MTARERGKGIGAGLKAGAMKKKENKSGDRKVGKGKKLKEKLLIERKSSIPMSTRPKERKGGTQKTKDKKKKTRSGGVVHFSCD